MVHNRNDDYGLLCCLKPHSHRAYNQVTTYLRPKMLESWANRRKNVRLVAEVVNDRQGKISRSKVVVMFKTSHTGLSTRLPPTCDRKMLESWAQIVERRYDWSQRSYDWSQRSWMIARTKSVVTRYATAAGDRRNIADRSHLGPIATNRTIRCDCGLIHPSHRRRGATTVLGQNRHHRSDTASSFS